MSIPLGPFQIFPKIRGDIREWMHVVDTGDKFTPLINIDSRISSRIFEKNWNGPDGIRGPGEHWLIEKNLKLKISCQTPFKRPYGTEDTNPG